jgi:hypothetical protein
MGSKGLFAQQRHTDGNIHKPPMIRAIFTWVEAQPEHQRIALLYLVAFCLSRFRPIEIAF